MFEYRNNKIRKSPSSTSCRTSISMISFPSHTVSLARDEIVALFLRHFWILIRYRFLSQKRKEAIKRFVVKIKSLSSLSSTRSFFFLSFFHNLLFSDTISYLNVRYQNFEIDSFVSKEYFQLGDKIWSNDYVGCSRINDYKNNSCDP